MKQQQPPEQTHNRSKVS